MDHFLDLIKLVADVLLIPIMGMVWSVQGRISKLEGSIEAFKEIIRLTLEHKK